VLVVLKLLVLLFFVVIAFSGFHAGNLTPFMPMGVAGVGAAASSIFFSYIGIDAVSTAGEEVKDPRRTLPLGIVLSLLIVTGRLHPGRPGRRRGPALDGLRGSGSGAGGDPAQPDRANWTSLVLCVGAIVSIFSITLVVMYGQTRILYAMSRDGLLPKLFQRLIRRPNSPDLNTYIVAAFIAVLAAFVPLDVLVNLTSMGTLIAFAIVSLGVIILRRTQPDLPRGYRVPLYPVVPVVSVAFCGYLIIGLPLDTWALFAVWVAAACGSVFRVFAEEFG
jgi:APA family basic amino acid/polyamine antiporter